MKKQNQSFLRRSKRVTTSLSLHSGMTFLSQVSMKDKAEAARNKNVLTERTVPGAHTAEAARESREVFPRFKGQVKYLKLGPQKEIHLGMRHHNI